MYFYCKFVSALSVAGIKGQLSVFQSTNTPQLSLPPPGAPKGMEIPAGLKQRWKPFGWGMLLNKCLYLSFWCYSANQKLKFCMFKHHNTYVAVFPALH